jgi:hypothetical protein
MALATVDIAPVESDVIAGEEPDWVFRIEP